MCVCTRSTAVHVTGICCSTVSGTASSAPSVPAPEPFKAQSKPPISSSQQSAKPKVTAVCITHQHLYLIVCDVCVYVQGYGCMCVYAYSHVHACLRVCVNGRVYVCV